MRYLDITGKGALPKLKYPERVSAEDNMQIDAATRRNLELTQALSGGRSGSLLATIDRTRTGGGARLLADRLANPSTDIELISHRQDAIAYWLDHQETVDWVRSHLQQTPDLGRALGPDHDRARRTAGCRRRQGRAWNGAAFGGTT